MNKLTVKVQKKSEDKKNQVDLTIEAPKDVSDKSYSAALRDIAEKVDIPGFRKGKAPREIIEKQVGAGYISQKAFEIVFYEIISQAAKQEKLDVIDIVEINSFELIPGKPLTFSATVELRPEVVLGKYKNLKVKAKKIVYDKAQFIDKSIEKIANNLITFKKLDDDKKGKIKVKEGDLVIVNFEGKFEDGTEVPGGKAENFQAVLEKDKFLPEFVEKLAGANIGDVREISVKFPENYSTGFSGKSAKFTVKVLDIQHKVLPEIDDSLAKKLGLENLDALKEKIVTQMHELEKLGSDRDFENNIVDEIIKQSKIEISDKMIQREIDHLLYDVKVQCEKGSIKWSDFQTDPKNKELFDKAKEASIKRISIDLLLNEIAKKENIVVKSEDIDAEVKNRILQLGNSYKHLENDRSFKNTVEMMILRNKSVDFLVNNNIPTWEEEKVSALQE